MDTGDVLQWLVPAALTAMIGVIGFSLKRLITRIDALEDSSHACKVRTAEFRTHVSENYSTKTEARDIRTETQHLLSRIHARLDALPGEIIQIIEHRRGS